MGPVTKRVRLETRLLYCMVYIVIYLWYWKLNRHVSVENCVILYNNYIRTYNFNDLKPYKFVIYFFYLIVISICVGRHERDT